MDAEKLAKLKKLKDTRGQMAWRKDELIKKANNIDIDIKRVDIKIKALEQKAPDGR